VTVSLSLLVLALGLGVGVFALTVGWLEPTRRTDSDRSGAPPASEASPEASPETGTGTDGELLP
jgi:hypothetical protein